MKLLFLAFVGLAIGFSVYNSQKGVDLSDLALNNIDALANNEVGNGKCTAVMTMHCCVCGNTHNKYAKAICGKGCETKENCHR